MFVNYLLVKCDLSRNSIVSYNRDLQIFTAFLISKNISDYSNVRLKSNFCLCLRIFWR
ncbi:MAG: site-specific integrase [Planctomycetia bacterium]|uniref:site-specific integrase n=1 Tax=Candidatus Brocadia sapporoensis TaxID=392547 RepID=UPI0015C49051|nr:site-specific integrase [Candidatus Brocadia sp.]QOJ07784.1 MAG: site-specific integrase [Planctomycetia bacterium]